MSCVKRHRGESYVRDQAIDEWRVAARVAAYVVTSAAPMETAGESRPGKRRAVYPPVDDRDPLRSTCKRDRSE